MATKKTATTTKKTPAKKVTAKITYPKLKYKDKGDLVVQLQDLLSKSGSSVKITGEFNIGTYTAVKAFQRKNGLKVDGIVENKTWEKLLNCLK